MTRDPLHEALESHPDLRNEWEDCRLILTTIWYLSEVHPNLGEHDVEALLVFAGRWTAEKVSEAEQSVGAVQLELDSQVAPSASAQLVSMLRRTWDLIENRGLVALRALIQTEAEFTGHRIERWMPVGHAVARLVRGQTLRPEEKEAAGWQDQAGFKRIREAICQVQWAHICSTLTLILDGVSFRDVEARLKQQFSGAVLSRGPSGQRETDGQSSQDRAVSSKRVSKSRKPRQPSEPTPERVELVRKIVRELGGGPTRETIQRELRKVAGHGIQNQQLKTILDRLRHDGDYKPLRRRPRK